MPIYEYECTKCGNIEEIFQKFADKPPAACKHCSGKLHKLISHSTFHLKGSGWYVTDYADKTKNKTTNSKTSKDTSSADSTSTAPSDNGASKKPAP